MRIAKNTYLVILVLSKLVITFWTNCSKLSPSGYLQEEFFPTFVWLCLLGLIGCFWGPLWQICGLFLVLFLGRIGSEMLECPDSIV